MNKENPWKLSPEKALEVDKMRQEQEFLKATFSELLNQIELVITQHNFSNKVKCIASPAEFSVDVLTTGGEEFQTLLDTLTELTENIDALLEAQSARKKCLLKITNACLTVSFK